MKTVFSIFLLILLPLQTVALDLNVISYNVESGSDTNSADVAKDLRRIPKFHIWGLSEVNSNDFNTYRNAIGTGFKLIKGTTGGADRLAIVFDPDNLEQIGQMQELSGAGGSRHPLMAHFKVKESQQEFLFVVNHLQRGKKHIRQAQAKWLNEWAQNKTKEKNPPAIILVGDYNFDFSLSSMEGNPAFSQFMLNGVFRWVRPSCIADENCPSTGTGCNSNYDSILDFVFLAGSAQNWTAKSEILFKWDVDYCDNESRGGSDHRPISAKLTFKIL